MPYSTICKTSVCARKKDLESVNPSTQKTAKLQNIRKIDVFAARSTRSCRFAPSARDNSAFVPTAVPLPKAIIRFCSGNASEMALSAFSFSCET